MIIFGTTTREDVHGVVGDVCPECRRVRAFTVFDQFSSSHVYFIPIGGWTFHARIKKCWGCGNDFRARLKDYDDLIEHADAENMSLRRIVRKTNYPLAQWMAEQEAE